jgi:hypothetical protein
VDATNSGTNTYNLSDTATNLAAAPTAVGNGAGTIAASGTASISEIDIIESFTNTGNNSYANITDTAANLAARTNAELTKATTVTASDAATAAQANTLSGFTKAVVYNISDTPANIAAATAAARNEAVDIITTAPASVAEATTIVNATNTGNNTYNLIDTAANLGAAADAVGNGAGTITATTDATVAEANTINGFTNTGSNTYNLSDTTANLVAAPTAAGNGAANITVTTVASVAQANTIENFTNSGANSYTNITDTATNLATSSDAVLSKAGTVIASTNSTAAEANSFSAFSTPIVYSISDTAAKILGANSVAQSEAFDLSINNVGASHNIGLVFDGNTKYYASIIEPLANISREFVFNSLGAGGLFSVNNAPHTNSSERHITITADGNVKSSVSFNNQWDSITSTGLNLNDGDTHTLLFTLGSLGHNLYVDGTLVAHGNATASTWTYGNNQNFGYSFHSPYVNFAGIIDSYRSWNSELTADQAAGLVAVPTPVHLFDFNHNTADTGSSPVSLTRSSGSTSYQTIAPLGDVTLTQLAALEALSNRGTNTYNVRDTAANLASSTNEVLSLAGTVTASDAVTAAQANTLSGFAKAVVYNISDTPANIAAATAAARNEAVNIIATGPATVAQATTIVNATNTGSNTYNLSDTATNLAAAAAAVGSGAGTITATTSATVAQSNTIDGFTNTGANTYNISDTAANLAASTNSPNSNFLRRDRRSTQNHYTQQKQTRPSEHVRCHAAIARSLALPSSNPIHPLDVQDPPPPMQDNLPPQHPTSHTRVHATVSKTDPPSHTKPKSSMHRLRRC